MLASVKMRRVTTFRWVSSWEWNNFVVFLESPPSYFYLAASDASDLRSHTLSSLIVNSHHSIALNICFSSYNMFTF